MELILTRQIC